MSSTITTLSSTSRLPKLLQQSIDAPFPWRGGRATKPQMPSAATYYPPRATKYEIAMSARDPCALGQVDRSWAPSRDHVQNWQDDHIHQFYPPQNQGHQRQQYQPPHVLSQGRSVASTGSHTISRQSTRPTTPNSTHSSQAASAGNSTNGDSMVLHSLQIPSCISAKGGNLADFSAQLTCLFWFESPKVLEAAEGIRSTLGGKQLPDLSVNAFPTESFRKWVSSVLSTTQVTQNVILLALMFIYRLKMTNPSVRGRPGSEYRLLTVALMLGNKFLDDNTYTNKTWAEVSGISVQEIHVMEVEFLSNMRYALLASDEQWNGWLDKLASYFLFWEKVNNPVSPAATPGMTSSPTLFIPSPTVGRGNSPLTSPTAYHSSQPSSRTTAMSASRYSPPNATGNTAMYPETNPINVSPLANRPDLGNNSRKRSWDQESVEPPAKRAYRPPHLALPASLPGAKPSQDARRLPVPSLTLNTTQQTSAAQSQYSMPAYSVPQAAPYNVSLPPIEPGVRAMSTVYAPPATTSWAPATTIANSGPTQPSLPPHTALVTPTAQYSQTNNVAYGTPTKRLSPINTLAPAAYNASSPLHEFPNNGFTTPISQSPSFYLQQRSSPYRPIRHVRTLLNPPPSTSLQGYHLPAIAPSQMHYQPIGRRNDERTGIVPEYRNQYAYDGSLRHPALNTIQPRFR